MKGQKIPDSRLYRFWKPKLPEQEHLFERFMRIGLTPQDHPLSPLELVCACSLMLETRTIYAVHQSIDRLSDEIIETKVDEEFFIHLNGSLRMWRGLGCEARLEICANLTGAVPRG